MTRHLWALLAPAALLWSLTAAAEMPGAVQTEIEGILDSVSNSGCEFQRNGSWHSADAAAGHLREKLQVIRLESGLRSAEDFIDRVATRSSLSGQAYEVRCGNGAAIPTSLWLRLQLQQYRAKHFPGASTQNRPEPRPGS